MAKLSLFERIKRNFAEVIIVTEKLDPEADAETIALRTSECMKCSKNINNECQMCGCYIDLKVKSAKNMTEFFTEEITHCPLGKWGDKELSLFYNLLKK